MKTKLWWMMAMVMAAGGGVSRAEGTSVSVGVSAAPSGALTVEVGDQRESASTDGGFALLGRIGHDVSRAFRVGVEVQYLPSVRAERASDDDPGLRILSPAARVDAQRALSPTTFLYAHGKVGYSRLMPPDAGDAGNGVMLGGGIGSRFALTPELDGLVELGYLWTTHEIAVRGPNPQVGVDCFLVTIGLALDL